MERNSCIFLGINPVGAKGAISTGKAPRAGLVEIKGHPPQDDDEPFFCSLHTLILPKESRMSNFNESRFLPSLGGWMEE